MNRNYILNEDTANRKLTRMAHEVIENNIDVSEIILAGIQSNGIVIARNIERILQDIRQVKIHTVTITLDKKNPGNVQLSAEVNFENATIIIIDDVTNSGKTLLYALKPFLSFHPRSIQTLVLVERTHTAFPVRPDYVGLSIATTLQEHIFVEVTNDKVLGAWLE